MSRSKNSPGIKMRVEKEKIFVFGASGHAKVIIDIIERQGLFTVEFLVDDNSSLLGINIYGYTVVGGREKILSSEIRRGIVAIGDNVARCAVADWLTSNGCVLITAVHPSAQIARGVSLGGGTVVMAGAVINSDTAIGQNVIINTRAGIDHDCVIGNGVHIAPGVTLCGGVRVDDKAFIGAGATIIPNLSIGRDSIVGAGGTVLRGVPPGAIVLGIPAKAKP